MKKTVNEAYPRKSFTPKNNGGISTRYIKTYAKRLTTASDAAQPNDAAADPSSPAVKPKEVIQITLKNIGADDAQQIKDTLIPNAKIFMSDARSKTGATLKVPTITFTIPDAKFAKWIKSMFPKIETILSASNSSKYPSLDNLQNEILEAVHSAPSEESIHMTDQSLKELEEAIYDAIKNNKWDEAVELYKKTITLVYRQYGVQLSPNNVKAIYLQAEKAGIKPTDKGAATNSYWDDGTEKFWPTFVRSPQAWRSEFGRSIKDEPKMKYVIVSGYRKVAGQDTINKRLQSQGRNSLSDLSPQEREAIKNGGLSGNIIRGYAYDVSDTEGPGDFFFNRGLLNNLEGTLTDAAKLDNEEWIKKIKDAMAKNPDANVSDDDKKRVLISTEEGRAQIFLDAMQKLCTTPKYEGGWDNLGVTIDNSDDKVIAFLKTVESVARKKIELSGWKNKTNIDKIAQMVTSSVSLSTVGRDKVKALGYDFRNTNIFNTFEECKSSVLAVSDSIISALHRTISNDDKKNAMDAINENGLHRFFNLMERMNNRYNENYNYELSEGIINRPSDDEIMSFLGELGLNIEADSAEANALM